MKREEERKEGTAWEVKDPKPPVIHAGHLEDKRK